MTHVRYLAPILFCLTVANLCHAQPPENANPAYADWFASVTTKDGISCCSIADGRAVEWDFGKDSYIVKLDGEWVPVPPEAVRENFAASNPTGRGIVWLYHDSEGNETRKIRCFVPAGGA